MLKVDETGMIRRMGLVKGYSIKEIARRLDVSRNTVRSVLRGEREVEAVYARTRSACDLLMLRSSYQQCL